MTEVDINGDSKASWYEVKLYQLQHGDTTNGGKPYDPTCFPIVRCFHHYAERKFTIQNPDPGDSATQCLTINISYAGNVFQAPMKWEYLAGGKTQ